MTRQFSQHEAYNRLADEILSFSKKVQGLFQANGWTWGDCVPTANDIGATLYALASSALQEVEAANATHSCVSAGRLQVRFSKYHGRWTATMEVVPLWERTS